MGPGRSPASGAGVQTSASFQPTAANTTPPSGPAPDGMVWIPGGEFSMGAADPPGMDDVGMQATTDARPIHRVYVDGFWMDATEVTNEQFAKFVKATGYVTVAEQKPHEGRFSRRAAGESGRRLDGLHTARPAGAAEQLFPVVELRPRRGLAPSRRARERPQRAARSIPWCTSPTKTPWPTRSGRASGCRPKRSGNSPRAAALAGQAVSVGR